MCVRHVFGCVLGRASSYVCVCVCIDVCVYVCRPIMLWKKDRMKHAEIQQSKLHVSISRAWTDKRRILGLITRLIKSQYCRQLCRVFALVRGLSLEHSRQWNVAPQRNTNVDIVQGKQVWHTRTNSMHSQAWARHVQAWARHARSKGTRRWGHGALK